MCFELDPVPNDTRPGFGFTGSSYGKIRSRSGFSQILNILSGPVQVLGERALGALERDGAFVSPGDCGDSTGANCSYLSGFGRVKLGP